MANQTIDLDFKTIVSANCYRLNKAWRVPDLDIDTGTPNLKIEWEIIPDAREWGIKDLSLMVTRVTGTITWETPNEDTTKEETDKLIEAGGREFRNDTIGGTIEIDSSVLWQGRVWVINSSDFKFTQEGTCRPEDCEIDFEKMTITIR